MSRTRSSISSPIKAFCLSALILSLTACGFRPLYGDGRGTESVAYNLAAIAINPIPDREGQVLRNHLLDLLTPRGVPQRPFYEISSSIQSSREELSVRKSAFATRANLHVRVRYALYDLRGEKPAQMFSSTITSVASFNVLDSDYATLIAEEDAKNRALRQIAEQMRAQISVRLKKSKDES